jgi:DNA gyrase/topoisomerase IV subunit A
MSTTKTISDFLAEEYRDFSLYTIENRAIPSVIDGFKPTHRKIIFISNQLWKTGNEKPLKVFQLAGKVASDAFYHHGNASLESSIITMAQSFKNNLPLLEEVGQFGSLRSPEPAAARYIGTRLTKNFKLLYKDFELLINKEEEGETIEPYFFLPIIPTVLINGSSGIAVGFSSNILNRNPYEITTACEQALKGKKINDIKPSNPFFTGEYLNDKDNHKKWFIRGKLKVVNTTTVKITELPPSMTFEKYENILDGLVESKAIVSYEDNCKDIIDYTIKFNRENLSKLDEDKLVKLLKLEETETEIFTTIDETGKLKIFESDKEIIEYFVNFRLGYYHKRKEFLVEQTKSELKILSNRGRFIKAILDNKIEVKSTPKVEIIKNIELLGLDKQDGSYDYLLRMPIWSLTKEVFEKLKSDWKTKKEELEVLEASDPKEMYIKDLQELKKKLKSE